MSTDLGITFSEDLSWEKHHNTIIARAYRSLGLIQKTFGRNHSLTTCNPSKAVRILSEITITLLYSDLETTFYERHY